MQNTTDNKVRSLSISPFWLLAIVVASIFVAETLVMIILNLLPEIPEVTSFFLDSFFLLVFMAPILYLFVFRPLILNISEYRVIEQELTGYKSNLENLVEERTLKLSATVLALEKEIKEREKAEAALRESEEHFRQIFMQTEDAVMLFAVGDCIIMDVNPAFEKLFEFSKVELLGQNIRMLLDCSVIETTCEKLCRDSFRQETAFFEQVRNERKNGAEFIASIRCKLISLKGRNVVYATFRDITEKIRLEEETRAFQAKMIHANKMTSLGLLVSSVAHEVNNPNNFIMINSQSLIRTWQDILPILDGYYATEGDFLVGEVPFSQAREMFPELFQGITEGARRISEIVSNLKNFVREGSSSLDSSVNLNRVLTISMSILNHKIRKYTDVFQLDLAEQLPEIQGSPQQLEQVMMNLVMNALQSLPGRNKGVRISTCHDLTGKSVVVSIRDEGCGISSEIVGKIFEPFFTTRGSSGGTGLGLSITEFIVKEHGGSIKFVSAAGRGTEFILRFPCG